MYLTHTFCLFAHEMPYRTRNTLWHHLHNEYLWFIASFTPKNNGSLSIIRGKRFQPHFGWNLRQHKKFTIPGQQKRRDLRKTRKSRLQNWVLVVQIPTTGLYMIPWSRNAACEKKPQRISTGGEGFSSSPVHLRSSLFTISIAMSAFQWGAELLDPPGKLTPAHRFCSLQRQ